MHVCLCVCVSCISACYVQTCVCRFVLVYVCFVCMINCLYKGMLRI